MGGDLLTESFWNKAEAASLFFSSSSPGRRIINCGGSFSTLTFHMVLVLFSLLTVAEATTAPAAKYRCDVGGGERGVCIIDTTKGLFPDDSCNSTCHKKVSVDESPDGHARARLRMS